MSKVTEYKGNKILVLNPEQRFPFSFGLGKARMIVENIEDVQDFVDSSGVEPKEIVSEFKDNPVITLCRRFTFGLGKAKLIVDNFADIEAFVRANND